MISIKASRFRVEINEDNDVGYSVYTRSTKGFDNITESLTDEEKDELISDLVYAITDLLKVEEVEE